MKILRALLEMLGEVLSNQKHQHVRIERLEQQMSNLDTSVDAVAAAESAAEVRIAAAEAKAAAAQATAEAAAKAAQDASAALQAEIDSINAGNAADLVKLADVKTHLDAINPAP